MNNIIEQNHYESFNGLNVVPNTSTGCVGYLGLKLQNDIEIENIKENSIEYYLNYYINNIRKNYKNKYELDSDLYLYDKELLNYYDYTSNLYLYEYGIVYSLLTSNHNPFYKNKNTKFIYKLDDIKKLVSSKFISIKNISQYNDKNIFKKISTRSKDFYRKIDNNIFLNKKWNFYKCDIEIQSNIKMHNNIIKNIIIAKNTSKFMIDDIIILLIPNINKNYITVPMNMKNSLIFDFKNHYFNNKQHNGDYFECFYNLYKNYYVIQKHLKNIKLNS